jgi:hypothetical protein
MQNKLGTLFLLICFALVQHACNGSKVIASAGYCKNEKALDTINTLYNLLYAAKPFALEFNDKAFTDISVTIYTDSIKYIYQFKTTEKRMADSLRKYNLQADSVKQLISRMKLLHCTWINNLDYYETGIQKYFTNISIRSFVAVFPFISSRYFILAYFKEPQYYDTKGRLLAGKETAIVRQINNGIFHRLSDKIAYSVSEKFR